MQMPFAAQTYARPPSSPASAQDHTPTVDVCVLGGGIVAAVAMLLARAHGLQAMQCMAAPIVGGTPSMSRTYAISPSSQAGLTQLGVWDAMAPSMVLRCEDMRVFWQSSTPTDTTASIHLSAAQAQLPALCSFVREQDLQKAVLAALGPLPAHALLQHDPRHSIQVKRCVYQDRRGTDNHRQAVQSGVEICLHDQPMLRAKLCIIAQGAGSTSAEQLGLAPTVYDYGHSAVVATLQCASGLAAHATAWQWLGSTKHEHDVLALLPCPNEQGSRQFSMVWSQATARAQHWCAPQNAPALVAAVQARCSAHIPEFRLLGEVHQFPLSRSVAPRFVTDHVALVGDTAHKIHPLAGQGLNLGLEDVFTLFEVLSQREAWRELSDDRLMERYQRRRIAHASGIEAMVHQIANRGRWHMGVRQGVDAAIHAHQEWPALGTWLKRLAVRSVASTPRNRH